jgi:hypothetical protein
LVTVLLATSLPNLEFQSKPRVSSSKIDDTSEYGSGSEPAYDIEILFRIMLIITGVLTPISLVALLASKKGRWRLLLLLILFIIWAFFIPTLKIQFPKFGLNIQSVNEYQDNDPLSQEERILDPPLWLVLSISLGVSVLITGGVFLLWRRFWKKSNPIEVVAQETQKAIDNLRSGLELSEGVIRYYHEMNKAIIKYHGLKRNTAMTTREFETYLETMGLPSRPIKRLTHLFEKARYGAKDLDKSENNEAVTCLNEIRQACRELK